MFADSADTVEAEKMSAYMRNLFVYFGLPSPKRKELTKAFLSDDKKTSPVNWDFVFECFADVERELQYAALDYLTRHSKQLNSSDLPKLKMLVTTKPWWDTVDCLDAIIGDLVLADAELKGTMLLWSTDESFWVRRIAIDHQLGFKDKTDTETLSKIIVNNLGQTEFFINKAIGWSLREYSKTNPDWVRGFLVEHKSKMANLSIREASKYL